MNISYRSLAPALIGMVMTVGLTGGPQAETEGVGVVSYASSKQVSQSLSYEHAQAFTNETGIAVMTTIASSSASIDDVLNGRKDVASSTRELSAHEEAGGLREFPFCVAPFVFITKTGCGIETVTRDQISSILTGAVDNWSELSGPDLPITVVVPPEETAVHRKFNQEVGHRTLVYDFLANHSTGVVDLVRHLPCGAVSFIGYDAVIGESGIKALQINGLAPSDMGYPYAQTLRLVTRTEPTVPVQAFVNYAFSPSGRSIVEKHGMIPLPQQRASR